MLDAIRAETLKLRRHRATWLMVWIFPVVVGLIVVGSLIYHTVAGLGAPSPPVDAATWIRDSTFLLRFPASAPGRCLTAGFAALVFAGEYGWNTWKLVVPARVRWHLIVAKLVVTLGFVVAAAVAADLIGLISNGIDWLGGEATPAGLTLAGIATAHGRAIAFALAPIVYTVAFAALFAILTRSLLAAVILSVALVIAQGLLPLAAVFGYARAPGLTLALVKGLPFYHTLNIGAWARGAGLVLPLGPGSIVGLPLTTSLAAIGACVVAAVAVIIGRFTRQDLD